MGTSILSVGKRVGAQGTRKVAQDGEYTVNGEIEWGRQSLRAGARPSFREMSGILQLSGGQRVKVISRFLVSFGKKRWAFRRIARASCDL